MSRKDTIHFAEKTNESDIINHTMTFSLELKICN